MSNIQSARSLGWASLLVGATELVATAKLQDWMGVKGHGLLIRTFGAREIAAGVTILNQPGINGSLAAALWARVAGDALDLAMLGVAAGEPKRPRGLAAVTAIILAITGLDIVVASRVQLDFSRGKKISAAAKSRVVAKPALPHGLHSLQDSDRGTVGDGSLITEAIQ